MVGFKGQAHLPVAPWEAISLHMAAPLPSLALDLFQKKQICEPFFYDQGRKSG